VWRTLAQTDRRSSPAIQAEHIELRHSQLRLLHLNAWPGSPGIHAARFVSQRPSEFNVLGIDKVTPRAFTAPDGSSGVPFMFARDAKTTNLSPIVNVGGDQAITLPGEATLAGTVSDDRTHRDQRSRQHGQR
jgi:hypothetical protein